MAASDEALTARRSAYLAVEPGASISWASRLFRLASILAIILSIVTTIAFTMPEVPPVWHLALFNTEKMLTLFFILEYAARLWVAPEHPIVAGSTPMAARLRMARTPLMLLDLVCILPWFILTWLPAASGLAIMLQVLRFLRLGRYSPAIAGVGRVLVAESRALAAAGMLGFGVLLVSATGMYLVESPVQPEKFSSILASMYWGVVTLATVGYGDVVPLTPLGRFIACLAILSGLILFALPIAIISRGFMDEIKRRDFIVSYGMVARVPLFSVLDGGSLAELVSMLKSRRVPRNVEIVRKGEPGDSMFFIASGEVEVLLDDHGIKLSQGDFFGEMAVLSKVPRSATVISRHTSELLVLDAEDVRKFLAKHPNLEGPLRAAAERRRAAPRVTEE